MIDLSLSRALDAIVAVATNNIEKSANVALIKAKTLRRKRVLGQYSQVCRRMASIALSFKYSVTLHPDAHIVPHPPKADVPAIVGMTILNLGNRWHGRFQM